MLQLCPSVPTCPACLLSRGVLTYAPALGLACHHPCVLLLSFTHHFQTHPFVLQAWKHTPSHWCRHCLEYACMAAGGRGCLVHSPRLHLPPGCFSTECSPACLPAGASRPRQAWLNTQISVLMGTVVMMVSALGLLACRNQLGALFSGDKEVVQLTSQAVPALAISLIGKRGWFPHFIYCCDVAVSSLGQRATGRQSGGG